MPLHVEAKEGALAGPVTFSGRIEHPGHVIHPPAQRAAAGGHVWRAENIQPGTEHIAAYACPGDAFRRMYKLGTKGGKRDLVKNWALPDRVFFACGACHILAYAFLRRYPQSGFKAVWICPAAGYTGNHIVTMRDDTAFDYHGYSSWLTLLKHMQMKAARWWPGWSAKLIELPAEVLISEAQSRRLRGALAT